MTADVQAKGWNTGVEILGPKVLDQMTKLTSKNHVSLAGFRTEKAVTVAHMKEAPFVAVLEGSYGDVIECLKSLEAPESKLAVNLMQVAPSDTGMGRVTATMGLVAFLPEEIK